MPGHDYAVLGYDAANQTFTLFNPWGLNNTNAPGILNLSWIQITQNFYLDGNCSTVSSAEPGGALATSSLMAGPQSNGSFLPHDAASPDMLGLVGIIFTGDAAGTVSATINGKTHRHGTD